MSSGESVDVEVGTGVAGAAVDVGVGTVAVGCGESDWAKAGDRDLSARLSLR
jgi:hypothetical protein